MPVIQAFRGVRYRVPASELPSVLCPPRDLITSSEALEAAAGGFGRLAVLMRPTPVSQILAVAEAGESLPPRTAFFHPPIPSGLVIHSLHA